MRHLAAAAAALVSAQTVRDFQSDTGESQHFIRFLEKSSVDNTVDKAAAGGVIAQAAAILTNLLSDRQQRIVHELHASKLKSACEQKTEGVLRQRRKVDLTVQPFFENSLRSTPVAIGRLGSALPVQTKISSAPQHGASTS